MSRMTIMLAAALLLPTGTQLLEAAPSPKAGISRTELMRRDLSISGREAIQVRVDFPRGAEVPRHSHPGEEIAHVLKGMIEFRNDGEPPVVLRAGDVRFIPAGTIHQARNVGKGSASVLATYIVEKGKPLVAPAR
jgi:quercetin dioxygenase-like cupin family protein